MEVAAEVGAQGQSEEIHLWILPLQQEVMEEMLFNVVDMGV